MANSYYFSHDYNARFDDKIKKLIRKHGMVGYGIFWAIIEDLYNNANALPMDCDGIAYELRTDIEVVKSIINDYDLFVFDGDKFGSLSVQRRLDERRDISIKASERAHKRWNKSPRNAHAMPTHSEGNAIKEIKKEIKEDIKNTSLEDCEKLFIEKTSFNWTEQYAKKEASTFYNFYASKDWMVGKNKMKSLSHAIGGWITRVKEPELKKSDKPFRPDQTPIIF